VEILSALADLPVILVDLSLSAFSRLSNVARWLVTAAMSALSCNSLLVSVNGIVLCHEGGILVNRILLSSASVRYPRTHRSDQLAVGTVSFWSLSTLVINQTISLLTVSSRKDHSLALKS